MNLLKSLVLTLLTAVSVLAQPTIVTYRISTLPNSTSVAMISYSDGHVELTNTIPSGLTFSRKGGRLLRTYSPSGKRQWNISQFGQNQTYSPTFRFAMDFNPGGFSVVQRKAQGINLFNFWSLSDADKASLPYGDGMIYLTESGFNQEFEGARYYECTLAEYEAKIWQTMPSCGYGADPGVKLLVFNEEQSNGWSQGNYGANSHWPSWESSKGKTIILESQTGSMTLEQLAANPTLMAQEEAVRRANRRIIKHKVAKVKGRPGLMTSDGSSMYQGLPRMDFVNSTGIFLDGSADVSHIGGNNGTITLNGRTYTGVTGSHWAQEDVMNGYYYLFDKDMPTSDYQAIFVNKVDSTQNYPYLWSKLNTRHIVADEKGYIQLNRKRMIERQGQTRPILRQIEPQFEGDGIALYNNGTWTGQYVNSRMTWNDLQPSVTGDGEPPKMWQPPYFNYSRYIVTRFFAGNEPGWGFYVFPPANPNWVNKSLAETPVFNHHLNSLESLLQARADLQPYEQWFTGSTLVEDPEVQLNGTGSFAAYSGTEAYNYNGGVQGVQKPAYMLRFKAQTNGDIRVVVVGGMNQSWTSERTDIIRAPSSFTALKGNQFKVKLRGPAAQVCEFIVKSTDTNQLYEALFNANTAYEKPGFAGRVGVPTASTSTGGVSTTTTTVTIPAFSQTVPYSAAAKSDFLSASGDGSHHYNQFITNADWADYTITGAPVTSNDYTLSFNYNTNYSCSGCGTGQYLINGGSPVSFPMDGADGGVRTKTFTGISLNAGTNTIRFRGTTSASTYFQNYVTVARASSTTTISTTVSSGTTCAFSVSAGANVAVSCGGSVTLSATASGAGATGLSYSWSRPSYSASGQSVTLTAPQTNGTFDYMATASKSGCAAQSATKLVTVSGCAGSAIVTNKPSFDTFDYQPITSNADWPGFDSRTAPAGEAGLNGPVGEYAELDNGTVRVRVLKRYGAAPGFISQSGGQNFINIHDLGTVNGMTLYRGGLTSPNPNAVINAQWAPNPTLPFPSNGTGNDPIQMGSTFGNSSPVVAIGRTANMIYTKTLFKNWPVQDETTDISMEQWVTLVNTRGIRVYYKITCNRLDDQAFYDARQQEFPTFYVRYAYATGAYIGEGGSVQYVSSPNNTEFYMSKPFVAMMPGQSASDVGIGLYGWGNYKSAHSSANSQQGGDDLTNGRGQSAMNVPMHFDWNGTYYGYHDFIVGTIGQMQDYVNAQGPDPRNTFAWKFNARNGRGRFVYGQGKDTGFPTPDTGVKISRLPNSTGFVDFHWPKVAIPASSVSKIYVRYKASSNWPSTGMAIAGRLSQVNPSDFANQKVNFSLTCNNTWQTVEIPVNSINGWSNTISNLQLTFLDVPTSADLTIQWVNTVNADPEP